MEICIRCKSDAIERRHGWSERSHPPGQQQSSLALQGPINKSLYDRVNKADETRDLRRTINAVNHSSLTIGFRTLCSGVALVVAKLRSTQQPDISINLLGDACWVCKCLRNQRCSWEFTRNTGRVHLCWRLGTGIYNRKSGESKQNRMSGRRHGVVKSGHNYVSISK